MLQAKYVITVVANKKQQPPAWFNSRNMRKFRAEAQIVRDSNSGDDREW